MFRRLRPIITILVPAILVLLVLDLALFRSGFYYQWVERESTAGALMNARAWALHQIRPGMKNVLVLGDSRIGQGFSPAIANERTNRSDINFVSLAIPGSTPRIWYYFLRSIDPQGDRFAAVVLMADSLRDDTLFEDFTNRQLDLNYLVPLVTPFDLGKLPRSFSRSELQERAALDIILPAAAMQNDIRSFIREPKARIDDIRRWNAIRWQLMWDYPGVEGRLPELDPATGLPFSFSSLRPGLQQKLRGYFHGMRMKPAPEKIEALNGYRSLWIGDIAARYREHGVPVIVFQIPRGPYHMQLVPALPANGTYAAMADAGQVKLLDATMFVDLEQPQYFFDQIHLNTAGRRKLSERLPGELSTLIP